MGERSEKPILKESQKRSEKLLFEEDSLVQHPYTLSLDLYRTTLVSLVANGAISSPGKTSIYEINNEKLSQIMSDLERVLVHRSRGSYLNVVLQFSQTTDNNLQAKL